MSADRDLRIVDLGSCGSAYVIVHAVEGCTLHFAPAPGVSYVMSLTEAEANALGKALLDEPEDAS